MKLEIRLIKEFNDDASMLDARDDIKAKATQAGYLFMWCVKND